MAGAASKRGYYTNKSNRKSTKIRDILEEDMLSKINNVNQSDL